MAVSAYSIQHYLIKFVGGFLSIFRFPHEFTNRIKILENNFIRLMIITMLKFNDSMLFIDMILVFHSDVKIPRFSSRVHIFMFFGVLLVFFVGL
jgi:hypothetical protein